MKKKLALILALILVVTSAVCAFSISPIAEDEEETVYHLWDFEEGINGWGDSISSSVKLNFSQKQAETQALAFDFAYNPAEAGNWNNCPIFSSPMYMAPIGGSTAISFEVYLEKGKATKGSIEVFPIVQSPQHSYWFMMGPAVISAVSGGEDVGNNLMKYTLSFDLIDSDGNTMTEGDIIHVLTFTNCGVNTDYNGTIYYDNIKFVSYPEKPKELTASTSVKGGTAAQAGDTLSITCKAAGGEEPYSYTFYALKGGKIEYKSEIWTKNNTAEIQLNEVGDYRIMTYCRDAKGKKVSVTDNVTVTVTPSTATKYIALTFDDGPDSNTGIILDTLKEKNAKATFFVLYTNAQYNEALVKRAFEEGHELGNHTKNHNYLTRMTQEQALEEIYSVNDFVYNLTGKMPVLYRPPYLAYNSNVLAWFPNMTAIGCDIDTADWSGIPADEITSKVLNNAKNGDIVLMHAPMAETRKALPDIIDGLHEMGFECVTVSELFELNNVECLTGKYYNSIYY